MNDVADVLLALQARFGWTPQAAAFDLTESWQRERSGSAFYHMTGRPAGPDVIVKVVTGWSSEDAEQMFEAMADLAGTIDGASIEGGMAIRPLGWSGEPAAVVMPYVEGTDVVSILRQPDHRAWQGDLVEWMTRAGAMLAAYHITHRAHPQDDIAAARSQADEIAARLRLDESVVAGLLNQVDWRRRCAGGFGDIGPGNLLGTADGDVYLIDPPSRSTTALIHRDLANFIFELRRQLAGRGFTRSRPVNGQFEPLRSAFIAGYGDKWPDEPLAPADDALFALFEARRALGMARRRFPSRPGDAVWFARSALARRREVRASSGSG